MEENSVCLIFIHMLQLCSEHRLSGWLDRQTDNQW